MSPEILGDSGLIAKLLDAYPAPTLVVDEEARVLFASRAARESLGLGGDAARSSLLQRSGHVLHCLNAEAIPEGCGFAPACGDCVVRNSVQEAIQSGAVQRAKAVLQLRQDGAVVDHHFLVSAAAVGWEGRTVILLTLEDVSELAQLRKLLPVCMSCGRIRNPQGIWQELPLYLKEQADIDVTHGLCATCLEKHYPG